MGAQTTTVMNTSYSKAEANILPQSKALGSWWKQNLAFDSQTVFTLGLDEKLLNYEGKNYHLPFVKIAQNYVDELEFNKHNFRFIASFKIVDKDFIEPVPFEEGEFAVQVEIPFDSIYIVQRKKGIIAKEETIYRT